MKLYDPTNQAGHAKLLAIRRGLIDLKHEVKLALKSGHMTVDIHRLNERLQHIAKIPREGLPKQRCNGRCRCARGIVDGGGVVQRDRSVRSKMAPGVDDGRTD